MMTTAAKRRTAIAFLFGVMAMLYAFDLYVARSIPISYLSVALPFDLMVFIPAVFYLLVIRRLKTTPLLVLPIMWLGCFLSLSILDGSDKEFALLLASAVVAVEIAIMIREFRRFARTFAAARKTSHDPVFWFSSTLQAMLGSAWVARLGAVEASMYYYALFSWKSKPLVPKRAESFTYHKESGYAAMIIGFILVLPVETVVVHMLVSQWSAPVAWAMTLSSVYLTVWLIGDCRACALRPVCVTEDFVVVRCGLRFAADIPLDAIVQVGKNAPDLSKENVVNQGMFYQANCWIVLDRPLETETFFGGKRTTRAIGLTLDDPTRFKNEVERHIGPQIGPGRGDGGQRP